MDLSSAVARLGCHRIPERCFAFKGTPMPLCSRCLGACLGHALSLGLLLLGLLPTWQVAVALAGIMFADWAVQEWAGIMSTNRRRLVTGTLGGLGVGSLYWMGLRFVLAGGLELLR